MTPIWNVSTVGVPFMDLSPDGSLGAVIDWSGLLQGSVKANGKTAVVPELPIPVEIEASLSLPEGPLYLHVVVEDMILLQEG
ncbi:MAG: hypothetical protein PWQ79_665 [Thermococcaceae archaeon]|nr:hypothetical protein [Thermococcaceae archaeon]MDK2913750.1 hypothetical protein [Thermococcaceae archaeon]